jgi:hypothetical protein
MGAEIRFVRRVSLAGLLTALTLASPAVHAQAIDDATRAAARQLGYEGITDFQGGNYDTAADKLDRAYRALRAPSLGLWSARAFAKKGKLVAASERYMEVQRLDPGSGDVAVQKQAQVDAAADHAALLPRIPGIVIAVEGAPVDKITVSVNGAPVPSSLVGVKRLVDPGTVKVDGQFAGARASETVNLGEGETKTVTLRFADGSGAVITGSTAAHAPTNTATSAPAEGAADQPAPSSSSGRRTLAWIVLGAGGVGILTGAVTGGLAMSTRSGIEGCEDTSCPPSARGDVQTYNRYRTISTIGFIAGGALTATGAVLILTAPKSPAKRASASAAYRLSPWVGVEGAGLAFEIER